MVWINIKEKTPSLEDIGKEFLVAVKLTTRHEYEIAEWFDSEDGETEPFFNIEIPYCGQHPIKREVTHWAELIELPNE